MTHHGAFNVPSWVVVERGSGLNPAHSASRVAAELRDFRRARRPSPIVGRRDIDGRLFPGHMFVSETALPTLARLPRQQGWRPLRTDKGRPLCLPDHVITTLGAYCSLGPGEDIPAHLAPLDVLGGDERIWFVLETWLRWPTTPLTMTEATQP